MDFDEDFLLMGHDGPFHLGIAEGKPILRGLGLYHGKRGYGVSVEARVKLGPVTLLAITQTADGQLKMLALRRRKRPRRDAADRQYQQPHPVPARHDELRQPLVQEGPTHHCALGVGHVRPVIRHIASLLKLPYVEVE